MWELSHVLALTGAHLNPRGGPSSDVWSCLGAALSSPVLFLQTLTRVFRDSWLYLLNNALPSSVVSWKISKAKTCSDWVHCSCSLFLRVSIIHCLMFSILELLFHIFWPFLVVLGCNVNHFTEIPSWTELEVPSIHF